MRRSLSGAVGLAVALGLAGVACAPVRGASPTVAAPANAGLALPASVVDGTGRQVTVSSVERIVTLGASATETVHALGMGDRLVGTDDNSFYPPDAAVLPRIGSHARLSAESVLSVRPTVALGATGTEASGPPEALEQVAAAGVPVVLAANPPTLAAPALKIQTTAEALGVPERGGTLIAELERDLAEAQALVASNPSRPRVLFLYVRPGGVQNVLGTETTADAMIVAAGGINAAADAGIVGSKPMTPEAVVAARPDFILGLTRGVEAIGGVDAVVQLPGVALTPAGQARRVLHFEDTYMLGMGPRAGKAVVELFHALHD
jgi:iron complex transport system substrate-binding protein